jgi:hypothetical protein
MNFMRRAAAGFALLTMFAVNADVAMAGRTQIVLQWLDAEQGSISSWRLFWMESALEAAGRDVYFVDGHDRGSGTTNVFLLVDDGKVEAAIQTAIRAFEQNKLPTGMRIGRAIYEDEQRKNWHYEPVYPPGLAEFEIFYQKRAPHK